jgi:hypothetical protein
MGVDTAKYEAIMRLDSQRARYEGIIELAREQGCPNPHVDPVLMAAADAFDAATARGGPTRAQLATIVGAASHKLARIWYDGIRILRRASERWPEAAEAIRAMSRDTMAHVRFCALCSLGTETPPDVTDAVIKAGLTDRSANVRWKAADRAASLKRVHLAPEIEAALAAERNERARRSIRHDLQRLRGSTAESAAG